MFSKLFAAIFALVLSTSLGAFSAAHAVTVSASYSYSGDICDDFDADGGVSGTDFNDCDEIVQDGGEVGLFGLICLPLMAATMRLRHSVCFWTISFWERFLTPTPMTRRQ